MAAYLVLFFDDDKLVFDNDDDLVFEDDSFLTCGLCHEIGDVGVRKGDDATLEFTSAGVNTRNYGLCDSLIAKFNVICSKLKVTKCVVETTTFIITSSTKV